MTSLKLLRYLERILNERAKGLEMLQPKLETFLLDTINSICLISIYTMDTFDVNPPFWISLLSSDQSEFDWLNL